MNFSLVCWDLQRDLLRILKYKSWSPNSMRASLWKCTPATEMEFQPWRVALEIVHMSQESELQNERIYCVYIYIHRCSIPNSWESTNIVYPHAWGLKHSSKELCQQRPHLFHKANQWFVVGWGWSFWWVSKPCPSEKVNEKVVVVLFGKSSQHDPIKIMVPETL